MDTRQESGNAKILLQNDDCEWGVIRHGPEKVFAKKYNIPQVAKIFLILYCCKQNFFFIT